MSVTPIPKGTGKAPSKSIPNTSSLPKKKKSKRAATAQVGTQFRSAIKKCLKEVSADSAVKITEKTLAVLCSTVDSFINEIISDSAILAKMLKKETIGPEDVVAAFELRLNGELRKLCVREMRAAVQKSNPAKATK